MIIAIRPRLRKSRLQLSAKTRGVADRSVRDLAAIMTS
jgi:hypothetical protein